VPTVKIDMKSYHEVSRAFYLEPLALAESAMLAVHQFLWPRITGKIHDPVFESEAAQKDQAPPASNRMSGALAHMRRQMAAPETQSSGPYSPPVIVDARYYWSAEGHQDTAVIPVVGMLSKCAGPFAESCMGAVNPDRISHALDQAMAAKEVKNIVIDANSPGGRVTYMPELAAKIKRAADTRGKTLYAFSDQTIASAMTWLASQVNEVIITPSASIGSIGTYLAFLNPKLAMSMQGYSLEFFGAGTHKGLGLPGKDLTQADREYLQTGVDKVNAQFTSAVKAARPKVTEEALRDAKMYDGKDAVKNGLVDGIAESWDEFLSLI
jgi:signal peptide peptidase SppA